MEVNLALVHSGSTPMQICVVWLPLVICVVLFGAVVHDSLLLVAGIFFVCILEMCANDFLHSHSLPFPCNQFPFLPIPIPSSITIPIPIPFPWTYSRSHSHSHAVDRNIMNVLAVHVKKTSLLKTAIPELCDLISECTDLCMTSVYNR